MANSWTPGPPRDQGDTEWPAREQAALCPVHFGGHEAGLLLTVPDGRIAIAGRSAAVAAFFTRMGLDYTDGPFAEIRENDPAAMLIVPLRLAGEPLTGMANYGDGVYALPSGTSFYSDGSEAMCALLPEDHHIVITPYPVANIRPIGKG